ncbi:MAG: hypothetical protein ABIT01_13600, partial [Thermoanaerobaculia bacterium]
MDQGVPFRRSGPAQTIRRHAPAVIFAVGAFLAACTAPAQSIQTLVGGGDYDGRSATAIGLAGPAGVALDSAGAVFLAEAGSRRVLRIDPATGLVSTVAGNGGEDFEGDGVPATKASIGIPKGICFDTAGNLYIAVASKTNSRIWRVDAATGTIRSVAGAGAAGIGGDGGLATSALLQEPSAIAVDGAGNLFIADTLNNVVRRVDASTKLIKRFAGNGGTGSGGDSGPADQANLVRPGGVAVDATGNVFISDTNNNAIRRVDIATNTITRIAGTGAPGDGGDGGAATSAFLRLPTQLAVDRAGNVYVADTFNHRVRRIARDTGLISSVAGIGTAGFSGDQGQATLAALSSPASVAVAASGLYISDARNFRLRRVAADGIISTVAGSGAAGAVGDGGPGTGAVLGRPFQLALSPEAIFIADYLTHRIRRYDLATKIVTTVAGSGNSGYSGDGGPAVAALLNLPVGVALDAQGNLFIADAQNHVIRRVDGTGRISTIAGIGAPGSSGDGGLAVDAALNLPYGIAIDTSRNLYVAEFFGHRIRRISLDTGMIETVAGTGVKGSSGDQGPATSAALNSPASVSAEAQGNLLIADQQNHRIRRVDGSSHTITTIAGTGAPGFSGDGALATSATLLSPTFAALDPGGNVWITDNNNNRIRRVDAVSRAITTAIGSDRTDFTGDGGPASAAGIRFPNGIAFNAKGDLFFSDTSHGRVRAVLACVTVPAPTPVSPSDDASEISTAPTLTWTAAPGAFRYDLFLDTAASPQRIVAPDLTDTAFVPANLQPRTRYYWKVLAKGDRFCPSPSSAASVVRTFVTGGACQAPGAFGLTSPSDGATGVPPSASLSWQSAAGASGYDVFLGTSNPPPFLARSGAATSYVTNGLSAGTKYFWYVTARAACDAARRTSTAIASFTVAGSCPSAGAFNLVSPSAGAVVAPAPTLSWSQSANASSYELYFGEDADPPLYLSGLAGTSVKLSGLGSGITYFWRVVARASCATGNAPSTPVSSFMVRGSCLSPGAPAFSFIPSTPIGTAQTYAVSWLPAPDLDAGGGYVIERSLNASFSPVLDYQRTTATSASFVSRSEGTYFHRVHAEAGCPAGFGPYSDTRSVVVANGSPGVVFTVQPQSVVAGLNQRLEDLRSTLVVENLGKVPVALAVVRQEISSIPFFRVVAPLDGDVSFVSLQPRVPKTLEIRYSGPRTDQPGTFQGVIFLRSTGGAPLPITPYAFVNLRVGGSAGSVPPVFSVGGLDTEYASFTPFSGDDGARPPLSVDIRNTGSTPMDLGGEVGPEVWLVPNADWNSTPVPAGGSRSVRLFTQRARAPNGSALPRYTYFTVRSTSGATARLLVQDNEATAAPPGPRSSLPPSSRSFIVPSVVSNRFVSRVRLSNVSSDAIQADLYFTPVNADGFDAALVKKATVLVPPGDVVTLSDPLVQLFGLTAPAVGTLEVRAPPEKTGLLIVTSVVEAAAAGGGAFGFQLPTVVRGEGANLGHPHAIAGITATAASRTNLILVETTGLDAVSVRASLFDDLGNPLGDAVIVVPRLGQKQVSSVSLGAGDTLKGGRIELEVESGGGSVLGLVTVIDNVNDDAVTYVAHAVATEPSSRFLLNAQGRPRWARAAGTQALVIPAVVHGFPTFIGGATPFTFQSLMGFISVTGSAATFQLSYDDLVSRQTLSRTVTVPARQTREYPNV